MKFTVAVISFLCSVAFFHSFGRIGRSINVVDITFQRTLYGENSSLIRMMQLDDSEQRFGYGIQCYTCFSVGLSNPTCNKITDDTHLINFKTNGTYCYTMIKKGPHDVLLHRNGITTEELPELIKEVENSRYTNHTIDFFKCRVDKCNDHIFSPKLTPKPEPKLNRIDDPNLQDPKKYMN